MSFNEIKVRGTVDFPIELYCIDKTHDRYEMVSHWHSELEIIRILDGRLNIKLNNNVYTAERGDIFFVNPETVHGAAPEECVYECIDFNIDFLSGLCDGIRYFVDGVFNGEYLIKEEVKDRELKNASNDVFEALKLRSSGYKFKVIGALYKMLGIIVDGHFYTQSTGIPEDLASKNIPKLKNVISFIHKNYDSQILLSDMAAAAEMSPKYFCYFFKEMTRKTPVEYLNAYRIEKASKKLLNTSMSVTEIAYSCGFNDLSYFIKTFKQQKGVTPAAFRKN